MRFELPFLQLLLELFGFYSQKQDSCKRETICRRWRPSLRVSADYVCTELLSLSFAALLLAVFSLSGGPLVQGNRALELYSKVLLQPALDSHSGWGMRMEEWPHDSI